MARKKRRAALLRVSGEHNGKTWWYEVERMDRVWSYDCGTIVLSCFSYDECANYSLIYGRSRSVVLCSAVGEQVLFAECNVSKQIAPCFLSKKKKSRKPAWKAAKAFSNAIPQSPFSFVVHQQER